MSSVSTLRSETGPLYLPARLLTPKDIPFPDLHLIGSDGATSRAHRVVLGASCSLLKRCLLEHPLAESDEEPVIIFPDYSFEQIESFLEVIYGNTESIVENEVGELLRDCCFRWHPQRKEDLLLQSEKAGGDEEGKLIAAANGVEVKDDASSSRPESIGSYESDYDGKNDDDYDDEEDEEEEEDESSSSDEEPPSPIESRKRGRGRPRGSFKRGASPPPRQKRRRKAYEVDPDNPGNFLCPEEDCDFSHPKRFAITSHFNMVHNKVECPHCSKRLCRSTLPNHIARKHTKNPRIGCEHCSKMFYSKHELEVHRNKDHGIASDHIICESCGKDFSSRDVYRRHQYRCQKAEGSMKDRVPYACKLDPNDPTACPAEGCAFRNKSTTAIKKHYRIKHERQICPHCGREYTYYGMKEHIAKEHTKDLKFECDVCLEKFFNEGYLREHKEREHIRELLYVCDKCGKGFYSRKLVARHKNEVHNQCKHNPCPICNTVYRNRKSLRNHMTSTHHTKLAPKR